MLADGQLSRRAALRGGGVLALAVFAPIAVGGSTAIAVPFGDPNGSGFLDDDKMRTLRAVVDRIVPADADAGAVAAGCADAIDSLLAAFQTDPPRIYAGAPFSDRAGSEVNHFEEFLRLDRYEEMAWRLRIEGSDGTPGYQGYQGYQAIYRDGLVALDEAAGLRRFADLTAPERDLLLRTSDDARVKALMDISVPHTLELMYGAPEYGGNADLVGWKYTKFDGDVQPRGWTREQIEERDDDAGGGSGLPELPGTLSEGELLTALAMAWSEEIMGLVTRSDGTLSGLQDQVQSIVDSTLKGVRDGW